MAELVHDLLHPKRGLRRARRPIRRRFGFVHQHVVAFDGAVFQFVAGEGAGGALHHRGTGIRAGFEGKFDFRSGDLARRVGAHLDPHPTPGSRTTALEYFSAAHQHLDRCPGLAGEQRGYRFQVERYLAAEPSADLHGSNPYVRNVDPQNVSGVGANDEGALGAAPDIDLPVSAPVGRRVVRLDVPLVYRRGGEFALDNNVGVGKPGRRVSLLEFHVGSDVAGFVGYFAHGGGVDQIIVQERRSVLHRGSHVDDGFQDFVVNVDQRQR